MPRYSDLAHRPHRGGAWPTWWYDPASGELLGPGGLAPLLLDAPETIAPLLTMIGPRGMEGSAVVYVAAGDTAQTAPDEDWYRAAALEGWEVEYRGGSPKNRTATMRRGPTRIDVRHVAAWYDGSPSVRQARAAHDMLLKRLRRDFGREGDSIILAGTPAQTGAILLDVSLPRDRSGAGYRYPVLSEEALALLAPVTAGGITFQHRREFYGDTRDQIPGYAVYDARLSYAAYLRDVPIGEPTRELTSAIAPYRPGWYRVTIDAPADWRHIGLAMDLAHGDWPREGRFDTWISEPELRLLIKTPGWLAAVHERIYWPERRLGDDPLRQWGDRLIAAYIDAERLADRDLRRMLKGAIRHLLLDTLGMFVRRQTVRSVTIPYGEPVDASTIIGRGRYGYLCQIPAPISRDRMRYYQPQIAGHIWARNRAALTRYCLALPAEDLLAVWTDAAHLALYAGYRQRQPVPLGGYRLKGTLEGPLPAPLTWEDIAEYGHAAEAVYDAMYAELYDAKE